MFSNSASQLLIVLYILNNVFKGPTIPSIFILILSKNFMAEPESES